MNSQGIGSGRRSSGWMLVGLAMVLISSISDVSHALYRDTGGRLWPKSADGITRISVCFISSGELTSAEDARQRTLVKEMLPATWGRWMKIEFSGFGTCANP